jgi:hypothetical protein
LGGLYLEMPSTFLPPKIPEVRKDGKKRKELWFRDSKKELRVSFGGKTPGKRAQGQITCSGSYFSPLLTYETDPNWDRNAW